MYVCGGSKPRGASPGETRRSERLPTISDTAEVASSELADRDRVQLGLLPLSATNAAACMRFGAKLALRRLITAVMTVTPPPIVVRTMSKDGAAQLSISLQQIVAADKPPKERTLLRAAAEPLSKSLARLAAGSSAVLRDASGAPIDPQTPAGDAYAAAASLDLDAETRAVWYCPAEVLELDLPVAPFVGLPLLPQLATAGCDADAVRLVWERRVEPSASWEPIARSGGIFVPTDGDVGAQLRVRAVPPPPRGASAEEAEAARLGRTLELPAVRRLPPRPSFAARLASLQSDGAARAGCTRVLSYNLLADAYRHHWDDPGGVHSFCDPALTAAANRLPALLDELLTVDADVLCLQEVDAVFWETFWRPQLELAGYAGAYARKVGEQSQEGCAVVVRRSRFDIVEARSVTLRLDPPPPPLAPLLAAHPQTAEAVASLPTVGQLLRLRAAEGGREVLVLNSHLYFANPAVHVRLMQTAALLDEAMRWRDALKQESGGGGGAAPALLVCGDFNSDRTDAVVHLLLRGVVEPTHPDWATGLFTWLKSSGCIPTARRAAADLAQRLALEGDGSAAEAPAPPAAAPAEANGGGGGAACARAWAAAAEGGSSRRGGTRCARACGCCATCGRPPTAAPPRTPHGCAAPRSATRREGGRRSTRRRVRRTPSPNSPANRRTMRRRSSPRRSRCSTAPPPSSNPCSRGSSPTGAPRASTASPATSFASPREPPRRTRAAAARRPTASAFASSCRWRSRARTATTRRRRT